MFTRTLLAAALLTAALSPVTAADEKVGTSTADAATLQGEFVVHNTTATAIHYQVKWGQKGEWKSFTVKPGFEYRHWHPLKAGKAPAPYVRFDNEGGDGRVTYTELYMKFGQVGYAGYGPKGHVNEAWHYDFKYRTDGKRLELFER
jgi:hypothetical protein